MVIAACIFTEQVLNYDWKDVLFDYPCFFLDTSVGIGQVKVTTAMMLEDNGYMNTTQDFYNPNCPGFYITRNQMVAAKLLDDETNIRYVAAYLAYWQDQWKNTLDISQKPDILGTLYNLGSNARKPNLCPRANFFGTYVSNVYSSLADLLY